MQLKNKKKELLLLLVVVLLGLLCTEILMRAYFLGPLALIPVYGNSIGDFGSLDLVQASNCDIIYELRPNFQSYFKKAKIITNTQGLRDKEYAQQKPKNTTRVAVLGDSFTMPTGVRIEDAYHSKLETYTNAEFINFGVAGYRLSQYVAVLKDKAIAYNPDHILVGIYLQNDVPLVGQKQSKCDFAPKPKISPYWNWWTKDIITKIYRVNFQPKKHKEYELSTLNSIIGEFAEITNKHNIGLTFVALRREPNEEQAAYDVFNATLTQHNITFIDTSLAFTHTPIKTTYIYPFDGHPNALGHQKFAAAIAAQVNFSK